MILENPSLALGLTSATLAGLLGVSALIQRRPSFASWCFCVGMVALGLESAVGGWAFWSEGEDAIVWLRLRVVAEALTPGIWLAFSLSYSRGNHREFLRRWRVVLAFVGVVPLALAITCFPGLLYSEAGHLDALSLSAPAKILNVCLLLGIILILVNLEKTFQAAVGVMRWRMKFLLLGLGLIFGARVYTHSQVLLFSSYDPALADVESGSLLIGSVLIGLVHLRRGFSEVDVYPSHAVIQQSVTIFLVGCYLFLVGVLAQVARWMGGGFNFQLQAIVVLAGVAGLGLLLLSERLRQRVKYFVSRHFRRSHHDFRLVWRGLTERLMSAPGSAEACLAATRMMSETFNTLSVTVWLRDEQRRWILGASTQEKMDGEMALPATAQLDDADLAALSALREPFDLENSHAPWAADLRQITRQQFDPPRRLAVILRAGQDVIGIAILGDRVYRMPYTAEELELLRCLADQLAVTLLNFRLGRDLAVARELETFQTMSAFFVHDLKNSASSLNLLLENLPNHFDNPEFREDALRSLSRTTGRIGDLISRLSAFRGRIAMDLHPADLNALIGEVVGQMGPRRVELTQELHLSHSVRIDREQIRSVVTNLLANAHDATPADGRILLRTEVRDQHAVLTVTDTGCGISPEFLRHSLFRPFQTTKNKGIGIGMFQSRMIVEAHRGRIQVQSDPGRGTTFQVILPLSHS